MTRMWKNTSIFIILIIKSRRDDSSFDFSNRAFMFVWLFCPNHMSGQNPLFKLRNRTIEIKWIAQYCEHILDNYINRNKDHDLKFQQPLIC